MNPIKSIRQDANLTQLELAELARVRSRDVVTRCEAGLYTLIPPSVLRAVAGLSNVAEDAIVDEYFLFQRQHRWCNRDLIHLKGRTHREFRLAQINPTVAGFCKTLCLPPGVWGRLEVQGGNAEFFEKAMGDCSKEHWEFAKGLRKNGHS